MLPLAIPAAKCHVWSVSLDTSPESLSRYWTTLSEDEQRRARSFRFALDREHFIVAHGVLRALLARYLDANPRDLTFTTGPHGKPALSAPGALTFNMSHARNAAAYIVASARRVGIDVEWMKPLDDIVGISRQFFSPQEQAFVASAPDDDRTRTFYAIWTRKEAFVKALGDGLSADLQAFAVTADRDHAELLGADGSGRSGDQWTLGVLDVESGYAGAYAVEGIVDHVDRYDWIHDESP